MTYEVIHLDEYAKSLPLGQRSLADILNSLSTEGWEFVQLLYLDKRSDDAVIVRRLESKTDE